MKRTFILAAVTLALTAFAPEAQAQGFLKGLADKAKEKVKQKVTDKVEQKISGTADRAVNGSDEQTADNNDAEEQPTVGNEKSDFVPGSVVVFEDAVKGEKVGEFPSKWDLVRGNAEIATVNGEQVIELTKEDCWIMPLISKNPKNYLGDEFSVEFDLMYTEGGFEIDFMHPDSQQDSEIFTLTWSYGSDLSLSYVRPNCQDFWTKEGNSVQSQKTPLNNKRWHHYAISFNKRAIKIYVDNVRYINVPNAKAGAGWMTFFFRGENPAYMKNVRIARGAGELYGRNATDASEAAIAKAIEETGKFVTNNILFETGKAELKAESMTEIQKVADYMKKNPSARFLVVGHTDNVGKAADNQTLSENRAKSVVAALAKLGVDDFNLKAEGRGASEPVADNNSNDGRAKNRRVEFIKK